jgi:hypothetical protein
MGDGDGEKLCFACWLVLLVRAGARFVFGFNAWVFADAIVARPFLIVVWLCFFFSFFLQSWFKQ